MLTFLLTLEENGVHGRTAWKKAPLPRKTLQRVWSFQKSTWIFHSTAGQIFCDRWNQNVIILDETHRAMCGENRHNMGNVKPSYPPWNMMERSSCFGASWCLEAWTDCYHWQKTNFRVNQDVYPENLRPSVCQMKLSREWVMQRDKNPNLRSKTTTE